MSHTHTTSKTAKGAGDENFPVASWVLPAWSRPHVMAFYAFARAADDIADSAELDAVEKHQRLRDMSAQLESVGATSPPSVRRLAYTLEKTGVTAGHAQDLIKAFRWDVETPRTADWAALMAYCQLSAAPVGRYLIDLFGGCDDDYRASDALCAALQVLNHLQDIADDCRKLDRVYVPADWMAVEGVRVEDLTAPRCSAALRRVLGRMLDATDDLLHQAKPLSKTVRNRALAREAAGILKVAERLSKALRRRDPLAERVELSKPQMAVWFLWGVLSA